MPITQWKLNRFERVLLWAALVLAGLLVIARISGIALVAIFHHIR